MKITEAILPKSSLLMCSALLWVGSFVLSLLPLQAHQDEFFLMAVVLCIFSALFTLAGVERVVWKSLFKTKAVLAFLLFWATAFISVLVSEVSFVSFIYFCFFSVFPLSFLLSLGWEDRHWKWVIALMAAVIGAIGVFALMQFFFMPEWLFYAYASWPFANPNSLGAMIVMGFFLALGWMLGAPSRMHSNIALVLCIILAAALFTTGSRGAFFSAAAMMVFFLIYARGFFKRHWRCLTILCVAVPLLFLGLLALSNTAAPDPFTEITKVGPAAGQADWDQRAALWKATWQIVEAHFWSGTGIGTFFLYYPEVRGEDYGTAGYMAHFEPLQFWAEQGIFAPILFYALLGFVLVQSILRLAQLPVEHPTRLKILSPFCALAAITIHTHASYNFHVLPLLMLAGLCFGYWYIWCAPSKEVSDTPIQEKPGEVAARYLSAAALMMLLGVFGPWQASEIAINRGIRSMITGDLPNYYDMINRSGHLSGNRNARALSEAAEIPLSIVQLNGPLMAKEELQKIYDQGMGLLDEAEHKNPRLAKIYYQKAELVRFAYGLLDGRSKHSEEAYLLAALKIQPTYVPARLDLSSHYIKRGEKERGYQVLLDVIDGPFLDQQGKRFYERIGRLAQERGDKETLARIEAAIALARAHNALWTREHD